MKIQFVFDGEQDYYFEIFNYDEIGVRAANYLILYLCTQKIAVVTQSGDMRYIRDSCKVIADANKSSKRPVYEFLLEVITRTRKDIKMSLSYIRFLKLLRALLLLEYKEFFLPRIAYKQSKLIM